MATKEKKKKKFQVILFRRKGTGVGRKEERKKK